MYNLLVTLGEVGWVLTIGTLCAIIALFITGDIRDKRF